MSGARGAENAPPKKGAKMSFFNDILMMFITLYIINNINDVIKLLVM